MTQESRAKDLEAAALLLHELESARRHSVLNDEPGWPGVLRFPTTEMHSLVWRLPLDEVHSDRPENIIPDGRADELARKLVERFGAARKAYLRAVADHAQTHGATAATSHAYLEGWVDRHDPFIGEIDAAFLLRDAGRAVMGHTRIYFSLFSEICGLLGGILGLFIACAVEVWPNHKQFLALVSLNGFLAMLAVLFVGCWLAITNLHAIRRDTELERDRQAVLARLERAWEGMRDRALRDGVRMREGWLAILRAQTIEGFLPRSSAVPGHEEIYVPRA